MINFSQNEKYNTSYEDAIYMLENKAIDRHTLGLCNINFFSNAKIGYANAPLWHIICSLPLLFSIMISRQLLSL